MLLRALAVCLCLSVSFSAAYAAESKPPKQLVEKLSRAAHDTLVQIKNPEGQPIVKPEDAKKLVYPLVDYNEREMAVARGYLSGTAKWCGLPWGKDYFKPYQDALKLEHGTKWTPYQYAYTEMLHGLSMAIAEKAKGTQKCPEAEKARIAALAKK